MFFNRNIEPSCSYCRFAIDLGYNEYACTKRGIVAGSGFCSSFLYEPTKRVPEVMHKPRPSGFSEEDFNI